MSRFKVKRGPDLSPQFWLVAVGQEWCGQGFRTHFGDLLAACTECAIMNKTAGELDKQGVEYYVVETRFQRVDVRDVLQKNGVEV